MHIQPSTHGARLARLSYWLLLGVPVGIVFLTMWAVRVNTSPTVSDTERIRGWETAWRELPATVFLIGVIAVGMWCAVLAGKAGAVASAVRAIWLHGFAMLFALMVVLNGSAENIMTTRPSTVKWLLFPLELGISALAVYSSRRAVLQTN